MMIPDQDRDMIRRIYQFARNQQFYTIMFGDSRGQIEYHVRLLPFRIMDISSANFVDDETYPIAESIGVLWSSQYRKKSTGTVVIFEGHDWIMEFVATAHRRCPSAVGISRAMEKYHIITSSLVFEGNRESLEDDIMTARFLIP